MKHDQYAIRRVIFRGGGGYAQLAEYDGEQATILREVEEPGREPELARMFRARFDDGSIYTVFEDEIQEAA